jgi:hypothetical protein
LLNNHQIKLSNTITKKDAYSILSQVANVDFAYDGSLNDNNTLTRGEAAQLMVDCFSLQKGSLVLSNASSQL